MVVQVEVLSKEMIKPSSPTQKNLRNHKLSFLDQLAINNYIPLILFYESAEPSRNIHPVQRSKLLKQSLSDVLTKFYPLAGKMDGTLSVDCDDSCVMHVEARVNADLSQMMKETTIEELNRYIPIDPNAGESGMRKDILLAVQATFFDCGGVAICLCIYHKVADGLSMTSFMNTWAATCRGDTKIVKPDLYSGSHHFPPVNFPGFNLIPSVSNNESEKFVAIRFLLDKYKLAELKKTAASAPGSQVKDPTRVEAVLALIFKHFIEPSRSNKEYNNTTFISLLAMNLRPRMLPPLPQHSFGNLSASTYNVVGPDQDKAYHNLVEEFRKTKTRTNGDYIQQLQNGEKYLGNMAKSMGRPPQGKVEMFVFTSWCGFPLYDTDFGWGKPLYVCPVSHQKNHVALLNTRDGDGIEAWVGMSEQKSKMLPNELRSLAIRKNITNLL